MHIKYTDRHYCKDFAKKTHFDNTTKIVEEKNGVTYIEFTPFKEFDWIKIAFSTRLGGVSKRIFSSMNFSFDRGDEYGNVIENFRLFTEAIGTTTDKCVASKQTHTTNVMKVTKDMLGMGILKDRSYDNIDGLITDEPDVCLVTSFADCVPLFFVDPINKAIASVHSGWRGTVNNITQNTVKLMREEYGTDPHNLHTFIGPCICKDCYEISGDVAMEFKKAYSIDEYTRICMPEIIDNKTIEDKYLLNLPLANYYNMINSGIQPENIGITDICTCCNPDLLFSHRASKGQRGVNCAFMYITH